MLIHARFDSNRFRGPVERLLMHHLGEGVRIVLDYHTFSYYGCFVQIPGKNLGTKKNGDIARSYGDFWCIGR